MGFFRGRVLAIGAILSVACGLAMYSTINHQLNGVATNATVLAYVAECSVEYQLVNSNRRIEQTMDCGAAAAFQQRVGTNKVILHRSDFVRLRYAEPGGKSHEVKAVEANVLAHDAPVGATLPIVYDPKHPDDARAPLTTRMVGVEFGMLLVGLFFLLLGLGIGPARIAKAFAGRPKPAFTPDIDEEEWSEQEMAARLRAAAASLPPSAPPWSTPDAQPQFGRAPAPTFGKRRA